MQQSPVFNRAAFCLWPVSTSASVTPLPLAIVWANFLCRAGNIERGRAAVIAAYIDEFIMFCAGLWMTAVGFGYLSFPTQVKVPRTPGLETS